MARTLSMEIKMLDGPICENVLQILDMTTPKPGFWRSPDQLLLQDTMESGPPEAPIWARGDPTSCMIFICITADGVLPAAANVRNEDIHSTLVTNWNWASSRPPIETRCWSCLAIKKNMLEKARNNPSGGLEFRRKCCNGLTNRHWAFGHIMTMKW